MHIFPVSASNIKLKLSLSLEGNIISELNTCMSKSKKIWTGEIMEIHRAVQSFPVKHFPVKSLADRTLRSKDITGKLFTDKLNVNMNSGL